MRTTTAALSLLLTVALTGCGNDAGSGRHTTADCTGGLLFGDTTYLGVGFVDTAGEALGTAQLGDCDDQGKDGGRVRFSLDRTVTVWTVGSVDPSKAIARRTAHGVAVFLAADLSGRDQSELLAQLGLED
jgi:hypothetical protein